MARRSEQGGRGPGGGQCDESPRQRQATIDFSASKAKGKAMVDIHLSSVSKAKGKAVVKAMGRQWNPRWNGSNTRALLSSSAPPAIDTEKVDAIAVEPNDTPAGGYVAPTTASKEAKAPEEHRQDGDALAAQTSESENADAKNLKTVPVDSKNSTAYEIDEDEDGSEDEQTASGTESESSYESVSSYGVNALAIQHQEDVEKELPVPGLKASTGVVIRDTCVTLLDMAGDWTYSYLTHTLRECCHSSPRPVQYYDVHGYGNHHPWKSPIPMGPCNFSKEEVPSPKLVLQLYCAKAFYVVDIDASYSHVCIDNIHRFDILGNVLCSRSVEHLLINECIDQYSGSDQVW